MSEPTHSPGGQKALAVIRASGHVIVDADLAVPELVTLAVMFVTCSTLVPIVLLLPEESA